MYLTKHGWEHSVYRLDHETYPNVRKFRSDVTAKNMVQRLIDNDKKDAKRWKIAYRKIKTGYTVHKLVQKPITIIVETIEGK
jgi:hypothetical protein